MLKEQPVNLLSQLGLSPEERLLLLCTRLHQTSSQRDELNTLIDPLLRWENVLFKAQWQGVTALVFHHLSKIERWNLVPDEVKDQLRAVHLANGARNSQGQWELAKVLDGLAAGDIPVILLKGATLAQDVYPDLRLRPMSDLDLLVPEGQAWMAQEVVQSLGYRPVGTLKEQQDTSRHHRHLPGLVRNGQPVLVEVHRHVVRQDSGLFFDISGFWKRARPSSVQGRPTLVLGPEDLLIHLSLNFLLDRRLRSQSALRQLCDIAESIRCFYGELSWPVLLDTVKEHQLAGPVSCALHAAQTLLGAPVPQDVARALLTDGLEEDQMKSFLRRRVLDTKTWVARSLSDADSQYRPSRVAVSALGRLFPNPQYLARHRQMAKLGIRGPLAYISRLGTGFRVLLGAVSRPAELMQDLSLDRWLHSLSSGRKELS